MQQHCQKIFKASKTARKLVLSWLCVSVRCHFSKQNTNEVQTELETNDDESHDAEDVESGSDTDDEF